RGERAAPVVEYDPQRRMPLQYASHDEERSREARVVEIPDDRRKQVAGERTLWRRFERMNADRHAMGFRSGPERLQTGVVESEVGSRRRTLHPAKPEPDGALELEGGTLRVLKRHRRQRGEPAWMPSPQPGQ